KAGNRRLAEVVIGLNDLLDEPAEPPAPVEDTADADAEGEDEEEDVAEDDEAEAGPTGPDPAEVARRMEQLAADLAKFKKAHAKAGAQDKKVIKLRADMAEPFVTFKLPLPLTVMLGRKPRDVLTETQGRGRRGRPR